MLSMIEWPLLFKNYISINIPIEQPVFLKPDLWLVYDILPSRLGIRLRVSPGDFITIPPNLEQILIRKASYHDGEFIEIFTENKDLFRPIYALLNDVSQRIIDGEDNGLRALELSLLSFLKLLSKSKQMSKEVVVGLWGELYVLRELLNANLTDVTGWIGPHDEPNDIRLNNVDLEIKTTTSNLRIHMVHGFNQLQISPGRILNLVSIRIGLAKANNGYSLNNLISEIESYHTKKNNLAMLDAFREKIGIHSYNNEDPECLVPYQLASEIMCINIGDEFTEINQNILIKSMDSQDAARFLSADFKINFEGLGKIFSVDYYKELDHE